MWRSARPWRVAEQWNRRLHYYAGLYFVFFLWLFALTGLLLNHGQWSIATAANQRQQVNYVKAVDPPRGETAILRALDLAAQLNLRGEIDVPSGQPPDRLAFSLSRPSDANQVTVDLARNIAAVQHFTNTGVATVRVFHTFSGSRFNQPDSRRDWFVTTIWVIAMDALAAGLIVMVLGSYVMWYRLKRRHTLGWMSLAAGWLCCAFLLRGWLP